MLIFQSFFGLKPLLQHVYRLIFLLRLILIKNTTHEVWFSAPGNYSDLKIVGCHAYTRVNNEKLKPTSLKCVLLGFKPGIKGYKLKCPETSKVIISRDVILDESPTLHDSPSEDLSNKQQQSPNTQVEFLNG